MALHGNGCVVVYWTLDDCISVLARQELERNSGKELARWQEAGTSLAASRATILRGARGFWGFFFHF